MFNPWYTTVDMKRYRPNQLQYMATANLSGIAAFGVATGALTGRIVTNDIKN